VADRSGRRGALIASMLLFGTMTIAASFVNSIAALGALRLVVGIGLGGAIPCAATLSSEVVPRRHRPFAVTLTIVCVPLGAMLAGLIAERALPLVGWRGLFALGGAVPFAAAALLFWLLPESPRFLARHPSRRPELIATLRRMGHPLDSATVVIDTADAQVDRPSAVTVLKPPYLGDTLALWGAYVSCLLAVYLGFTWVPSMLAGAGLGSLANIGITTFNLGGVIGAIAGSLAIARIGSRITMIAMAVGALVSAIVMRGMTIGADSATLPIVVMLALTGGLINAVQTTLYALAAHVYPTALRSTGVGSAAGIGRLGAILSSYAGAWALDAAGSRGFFTVVAAAMSVTVISLALVRRHVPARAAQG
jgi:AAHS family 4-hydroxybenzoate transporter-like MFS transporter